jgi:hypothetical protein
MPRQVAWQNVRLLQNIVLYLALIATVLEHLLERRHTAHAAAKRRPDLRWVHMLVQLIRISDARHVERLRGADKCPESGSINLSDNVVRNTVAARIPSGRDLTSDETVK